MRLRRKCYKASELVRALDCVGIALENEGRDGHARFVRGKVSLDVRHPGRKRDYDLVTLRRIIRAFDLPEGVL